MTAEVLLEFFRQSVVTPTYLRGLGGMPQHSPQHSTGRTLHATARP